MTLSCLHALYKVQYVLRYQRYAWCARVEYEKSSNFGIAHSAYDFADTSADTVLCCRVKPTGCDILLRDRNVTPRPNVATPRETEEFGKQH